MKIEQLAVPNIKWEDIVREPWTLKRAPRIVTEIEISYLGTPARKFGIVGKNTEKNELYVFYNGREDIEHLLTISFANISDVG